MHPIRIFVSSPQREFAREREALHEYFETDALMRKFFRAFLFEYAAASAHRPDQLYLDEVTRCDLYVGLFGSDYGSPDDAGLSPTEREFDCARDTGSHCLIFVRSALPGAREPNMQTLIDRAQDDLVCKQFGTPEELVAGVYAALVEYLLAKGVINWGPFDATACEQAMPDDLDLARISDFVRVARRVRQFPLAADVAPEKLLRHLHLLSNGHVTNAAVLLFGKDPQRFLGSSEIKCAHFHGTKQVKPILSYQIYKGTAFELVDQAVDFVLSKVALSVGTRAESVRAPSTYELPKEVVAEAIVNAVAHRDYTSNGSVQVMLFSDRLEVWNPGRLAPGLTLEQLRVAHGSVPVNRLVATALYLAEYIENMGTGTLDMIERCAAAGLSEPEFSVADGFVARIWREKRKAGLVFDNGKAKGGVHIQLDARDIAMLRVCSEAEATARELQIAAGYTLRTSNFRKRIDNLLGQRFLERTLPDTPHSPRQKYRLTNKGRTVLSMEEGT